MEHIYMKTEKREKSVSQVSCFKSVPYEYGKGCTKKMNYVSLFTFFNLSKYGFQFKILLPFSGLSILYCTIHTWLLALICSVLFNIVFYLFQSNRSFLWNYKYWRFIQNVITKNFWEGILFGLIKRKNRLRFFSYKLRIILPPVFVSLYDFVAKPLFATLV